jgi:hypothetical protein
VAPAAGLFAAARAAPPAGPPTRPTPSFVPPAPVFTPQPIITPPPAFARTPIPAMLIEPAPAAVAPPRPAPAPAPPRPPPEIELDFDVDQPALTPAPAMAPPSVAAPTAAARPVAAPPVVAPPVVAPPVVAPPVVAPPVLSPRPVRQASPVVAPPAPPAAPDLEPLPPLLPTSRIEGSHKVLVHTLDGEVKRGVLTDPVLDGPELNLLPQGPGAAQVLSTDAIKAVFFLLGAGEKPPVPDGRRIRITFRDGRQVQGTSPDYAEGQVGFLLIPAPDARSTTARIWVYQASVRQVTPG